MELPRRTRNRRIRVSVGQPSKSNNSKQLTTHHRLAHSEATEQQDHNSNSCHRQVHSPSMAAAGSVVEVALAVAEVPSAVIEEWVDSEALRRWQACREVRKMWDGMFLVHQV